MIKHYEMQCNIFYYIFMFLKLQLTVVTKRKVVVPFFPLRNQIFCISCSLQQSYLFSSTHYGKVHWNPEQPFSIASLLQLVLKHLPFRCHDSLCGHGHDPVNTFHIANIKERKCTNKKVVKYSHIIYSGIYINVLTELIIAEDIFPIQSLERGT